MSQPVAVCLKDQLELVGATVGARLKGLADEEFFWEPVPGCWTIRPAAGDEHPFNGAGEWIYDYALPDPDPPPFTTIGWRLVHIASINDMYYEHVFGPAERDYPDQRIPHEAAAAVAWWEEGLGRFISALDVIEDTGLERIVSAPWGDTRSVQGWVQTLLYENIHHGAEVGVLRDLYRQRGDLIEVEPRP